MIRPQFYILDQNRVALPVFNILEWAVQLETMDRRVALDKTEHWEASTVFLGLDHCWGSGDPVLFETMVFLPDGDYGTMERYSTWAEAAAGHERIRSMLAREQEDASKMTLGLLHQLYEKNVAAESK